MASSPESSLSFTTGSGKFLIGLILFLGGIGLIIPAAIGISEYKKADKATKKRTKASYTAQWVILGIGIAAYLVGLIFMAVSNKMKTLQTHVGHFWQINKDVLRQKLAPPGTSIPVSSLNYATALPAQ